MGQNMNYRIMLKKDRKWIDVTKRKVILYGAGRGCIDMMDEMVLPKVEYLVDSAEAKRGKPFMLLNCDYTIQSPDILRELSAENYYIVITNTRYAKDILSNIKRIIGENQWLICENRADIHYCYENIEDMLWMDPFCRRTLLWTNLSFYMDKIISIFETIKIAVFSGICIDRFITIPCEGSKLVFIFGNESELWVFSMPGLTNSGNEILRNKNSLINISKRSRFLKENEIDSDLTVYSDEKGILVQRYADEELNFKSKQIREEVLHKCYRLHHSGLEIDLYTDFFQMFFYNAVQRLPYYNDARQEKIEALKVNIINHIERINTLNIEKCVCHCDLTSKNIVCCNGYISFIDWEYLGMSDPLVDVCLFLYTAGLEDYYQSDCDYNTAMQRLYDELEDNLQIYYGGKCSKEQFNHAYSILLICEGRDVLNQFSGMDDKNVQGFLKRLSTGL